MPELNKDRIFNESPTKVLIREYGKLKEDYTKLNAIKYKTLYENASMSFILENSRYIFGEPIRGLEFYQSFIENSTIPFNKIQDEYNKISDYMHENAELMSEEQNEMYTKLFKVVAERYSSMIASSSLYTNIMENSYNMSPLYDSLYEYTRGDKDNTFIEDLTSFLQERESLNIIDAINLSKDIPEVSALVVEYVRDCYVESPSTPEDYELNAYTSNVLKRMMHDKYISESVNKISNVNLRHLIKGIAGVEDSDTINDIMTETVINFNTEYTNPQDSINMIYEESFDTEMCEKSAEEKLNRLLCERAVASMNLAFEVVDSYTFESGFRNDIVEGICVESTEIEKIPNDVMSNIRILQEYVDSIDDQIKDITEKYFSNDGTPSKIVATSIGEPGSDDKVEKTKKESIDEKIDKLFTPEPRTKETNDDEEKSDDEEAEERQRKKDEKTDKYASMDLSDEDFDSITEAKDAYPTVDKPEKRNIFQRIQNKALDTNVQFKKKVAEGQRKAVDARNAGKAVSKIPMSVTSSVKKKVEEWDELDDDKRKEYIIKPGFRKKYFRALKLCISHYVAFAINPILNVVLFMCQKLSNTKDVRIRNELVRELKAEIKVTEEKIEDAKANGDNKQKYKLMRIKEKLDAELVRVTANSKYI